MSKRCWRFLFLRWFCRTPGSRCGWGILIFNFVWYHMCDEGPRPKFDIGLPLEMLAWPSLVCHYACLYSRWCTCFYSLDEALQRSLIPFFHLSVDNKGKDWPQGRQGRFTHTHTPHTIHKTFAVLQCTPVFCFFLNNNCTYLLHG